MRPELKTLRDRIVRAARRVYESGPPTYLEIYRLRDNVHGILYRHPPRAIAMAEDIVAAEHRADLVEETA